MSISNHSTTRKSWRSDAPIILPGWECHTGGSRSKPTVHRCRPKTGGCGLLTRTQDEPTKQQYQTVDFSSGLAYTVSSHSHVSPCSNTCARDRCGDDPVTTDFPSGGVLTQEPSTFERSFALDLTLMPTQRLGNPVLMAQFRWRRLTLRCLVHVTQAAWQAVIDMWQQTCYRIAQTECTLHRNSVFVEPFYGGMCTEERKDQRERKDKGLCQHRSKSCTDRQWSIGKRDGQRLSKVQPRVLRVSDCRMTNHALSRMGPHWDAVYNDHGVSRRGRQFQREKYQQYKDGDSATGSGGPSAGPHAGLETSTLPGQDGGSQNPTLSNDWTAQMQVLISNPELAQEQFAQWQLIHQLFQHIQYQQQFAASSNQESWQMFHHPGEDDKSIGSQWSMDTRED